MRKAKITNRLLFTISTIAIASAAVAILFTPDSGKKTRQKVANEARELSKDLSKRMKNGSNMILAKTEELEDVAEEKYDEVKKGIKKKTKALEKK